MTVFRKGGIVIAIGLSNMPNVGVGATPPGGSGSTQDPVTLTLVVSKFPKPILYYVPFTITNSASEATPAPFQQMITVNPSLYTSYLASDLSNVQWFDAFGNVINSWLESGNSNTATEAVYWLSLANGIGANSTITVYMGIASTTTNLLNNTTTGEAPQLSSTYGEYDDGASVFSLYFNGNTPLSNFNFEGNTGTQASVTGPTGTTINVISITGYASNLGFVYTAKTLTNEPIIAESSSQQAGNQAGGLGADNGQVSIVSGTSTSGLNAISVDMGYGSSYFSNNYYSSGTQTKDVNQQGTANTNWHYASVTYSGSSATSWSGYIAPQLYSTSSGYSGTVSNNPLSSSPTLYLGLIGVVLSGYQWQTYINWMRARAYPPNGAMLAISAGSLATA